MLPTPESEVLAANEAFYSAFAERDIEAMQALWSTRRDVACVHPGWEALTGWPLVMSSWRAILSNPDSPDVRCLRPTAHVVGEVAFVVCVEIVAGAELVATNVFAREDGIWKLLHHHAGPIAHHIDVAPAKKPPTVLN